MEINFSRHILLSYRTLKEFILLFHPLIYLVLPSRKYLQLNVNWFFKFWCLAGWITVYLSAITKSFNSSFHQ